MQQNLRNLLAILCALFAASAAFACPTCQTGVDAPRYMSGGVGEEELAALRDREKDYNVKMVLADVEGAYLANADVVVRDTRGGVKLARKNLGPILLLQLPEGSYEVLASESLRGRSASRTLKVDATPREALVLVLK